MQLRDPPARRRGRRRAGSASAGRRRSGRSPAAPEAKTKNAGAFGPPTAAIRPGSLYITLSGRLDVEVGQGVVVAEEVHVVRLGAEGQPPYVGVDAVGADDEVEGARRAALEGDVHADRLSRSAR